MFESGGDIYCASASQMFRVSVEKNGVNGHLRQKGKIAELHPRLRWFGRRAQSNGRSEHGRAGRGAQTLGRCVAAVKSRNRSGSGGLSTERLRRTSVNRRKAETHGVRLACKAESCSLRCHPAGGSHMSNRAWASTGLAPSQSHTKVWENEKWLRLKATVRIPLNIIQATARDILAEAMMRLEQQDTES